MSSVKHRIYLVAAFLSLIGCDNFDNDSTNGPATAAATLACEFEVNGTSSPPTSGSPVVIDETTGTLISANFFNSGAIDPPEFDGQEFVSVCVFSADSASVRKASINYDVGRDNDFDIKGYPQFIVGTKFGNINETSFRYYPTTGLSDADKWPVTSTQLAMDGAPFEFANLEYISKVKDMKLPAFTNDLPQISISIDVDETNVVGAERDVMLESWFYDTSANASTIGNNLVTGLPIANTLNNIVGIGHSHYSELDNTLLEMMVHVGALSINDISEAKNNPGQNQLTETFSGKDYDLDGIDDHFDVDSHLFIGSFDPTHPDSGIYSSGVDNNNDGIDDAVILPVQMGNHLYSIWYGTSFLSPIVIYSRETNSSLQSNFDPNTADMNLTDEGTIDLPWNEFLDFTLNDLQPLLQNEGVPWAATTANVFERMRSIGGAIGGVEFGVEPQINDENDNPYTMLINRFEVNVDGKPFGIISNRYPIAKDDTAIATKGGIARIEVLANDNDQDNLLSLSSLEIITPPGNGTAIEGTDGKIIYTHNGDMSVTDSFTYRISDELGAQSNIANVSITIAATALSTCPPSMNLGTPASGVAVRDSATGFGWLMWSDQSVFSRFTPKPFRGNASHLIAITHQNSQWLYDNNSYLTPFTPDDNDCIVAELDFTNDTATTLIGIDTTINGIDAGYDSGDLSITADTWNGVSNNGEFGIAGTQINSDASVSTCPAFMSVGDKGRGVATRDTAIGLGWLMWSNQNVFSRFSPSPYPGNAEHLITVVYQNSQWFYDNNFSLIPFTPDEDDCLIAELDFTNDSVSMLQGIYTPINGIDAGYNVGDINVIPNSWNNSTNVGEFGVTGNTLGSALSQCPATMSIGSTGKGIATQDSASGMGWLMWSDQSVFSRFSPSPIPGNAEHLVAVTYQNAQWLYDNNSTLTPFTPHINDCLVAELDFTNDTVSLLQGTNTIINGIDAGYSSGDLSVVPDTWNGITNDGEFGASGNTIGSSLTNCPSSISLGNIGKGIAVRDSATGLGWLMWSNQSVFSRFTPFPGNAEHLIAVIFQNSQWFYDNNTTLVPFTPATDDCLVAELDFTSDTATLLQGTSTTVNGIDAGFNSGDMSIIPDLWNGLSNNGEFGIGGTYLNR